MINLFLNDNRYIAMDNRQQINKSDKAEVLSKIKAVFFQHFEQSVDDCCMHIDLEFGLQLGKNREKVSKEQHIKLLEYIRSVRKEIRQSYLSKVNEIFDSTYQNAVKREPLDFSKVSLVNDDVVKENHAVTLIIRQCEQLFYEELVSLNKHLAIQQGKQTIADSQNPVFPDKLIRALVEAVKFLNLNADARIALYRTFEANVFCQLGFIYREVIKWCQTNSPALSPVAEKIKKTAELTDTRAEQPSATFELLQKKLELWRLAHFPSAYDLISVNGNVFYEHSEIKNALQELQLGNDGAVSGRKKPLLKRRVVEKLEELSFLNIDVRILAKHDEDVLDLVSLIFSAIECDKLLEDSVKAAILQLEIPLAAVSLGQYSIFSGTDNSIRQLLDDLFAAGLFLNKDEHDDRLIQERIASAVKKMTKEGGFLLSGWIVEAGEFSDYLNKQRQRSQHIEENAKQFMINKHALESSRKIVATTIENSINGKKLPAAIVEFLRAAWLDVLLDAYKIKDQQPEQWEKSVQAMDELIVSVMPPADDNERKQILKLLPRLIAELRNGLKRISYDKSMQSRFFKELAVWHIILMDKKQNAAGDTIIVESKNSEVEAITDEYSKQAASLAEQSWVAFNSESGKQWGKLLWKDAEAGVMLFVGKNGAKIFEIQVDELAEKLRKGQAATVKIDEKTITERVLSGLMSL